MRDLVTPACDASRNSRLSAWDSFYDRRTATPSVFAILRDGRRRTSTSADFGSGVGRVKAYHHLDVRIALLGFAEGEQAM